MNDKKISADDPRLTAYALGELDADERSEFETCLQADAAAMAMVQKIRVTAAQLEDALRFEATAPPELLSEHAAAVRRGPVKESPLRYGGAAPYSPRRGRLLKFPNLFYFVGGLAAACFAIVVALRHPEPPPRSEQKTPPAAPKTVTASAPSTPSAPEPVAPMHPVESEAIVAIPSAESLREPEQRAALIAETPPPAESPAIDLVPTDLSLLAVKEPQVESTPPPQASFSTWGTPSSVIGHVALGADQPKSAPLETQPRKATTDGARSQYASYSSDRRSVLPRTRIAAANTGATNRELPVISGGARHISTPVTAIGTTAPAAESFFADSKVTRETIERDLLRDIRRAQRAPIDYQPYGFVRTTEHPLSTFSASVDTASYPNIRRLLRSRARVTRDAVRIEELLNYFSYSYPTPAGEADFAASLEVAEAPWDIGHRLVRIGVRAREVAPVERGPANLVFLIDVSGSMNAVNRLPLVKESMRLLLSRLRTEDRVAIITYAGVSGLALPSTPVSKARDIEAALDDLRPEGSTNGALGIHLAYEVAKANLVNGGINRVILCTDGDFNVGTASEGELQSFVAEKAQSGVFLTTLGFGMENPQDGRLQQLAEAAHGQYGYVETRGDAEKLLVEQVTGPRATLAEEVSLKVQFNPRKVASYRLIGYETSGSGNEDSNADSAGLAAIAAGHAITALYEIVPAETDTPGSGTLVRPAGSVKYTNSAPRNGSAGGVLGTDGSTALTEPSSDAASTELLTLTIEYKEPTVGTRGKIEFPVTDVGRAFADASDDFRFAASVAAFGMLIQDSPHRGTASWPAVASWAESAQGADPGGYRAEFVGVVKLAESAAR